MRIGNEQIAFSRTLYTKNQTAMEKSLGRLSTGSKLHVASENAAGITVSEKMRAQIRGLSRAQLNMNDGLSALETMDEGMKNISDLVHRARELAVMTATDTVNDNDRHIAQNELTQVLTSIDDTANNMEFNTRKILNNQDPFKIQVGANATQTVTVHVLTADTETLGLNELSIATSEDASEAIQMIDRAVATLSTKLTEVGTKMQSIEHHLRNAAVFEENLTRALNELESTDFPSEFMDFVQMDIRQSGDQLLIRQVNTNMHDILHLFRP